MNEELLTFNLSNNLVNVVFVISQTIVGDCEFSVGSLGSTVTIGQVVYDDLYELLVSGARSNGAGIS